MLNIKCRPVATVWTYYEGITERIHNIGGEAMCDIIANAESMSKIEPVIEWPEATVGTYHKSITDLIHRIRNIGGEAMHNITTNM